LNATDQQFFVKKKLSEAFTFTISGKTHKQTLQMAVEQLFAISIDDTILFFFKSIFDLVCSVTFSCKKKILSSSPSSRFHESLS